MKKIQKTIAVILIAMSVLFIGGITDKVCAASSDTQIYSFVGDDGKVDGSKTFTIFAKPGENFDIEIVFTGSVSADMMLSFAYDNVTEDQMVPNGHKSDSNDRSGLINELVKQGEEEVRNFSVAAMTGDIVITATGKGKVISIKAVKQEAKTAGEKVTVYTIGDSLVQTYSERYAPQTGWGQTMGLYFNDKVNFVNRALGGRSTGNYLRQGRLNQVLCEIAPGDYVLIEFGHNDADSSKRDRFVSVPNYKDNLKLYIQAIRDRGATPVLVTLCNRNQYIAATDEFRVSYPEYVNAMKAVAEEVATPIVDLNAITVERFHKLIKELGKDITDEIIYNHAIAGAYEGDYAKGVADDTHLQYYGAKLVAGYVAEELKALNLKGLSENYVPLKAEAVPTVPTGIYEKKASGFISRIKWKASEDADYYKVLVAEIVDTAAGVEGAAEPVYALADEFTTAGYTTACDFSYKLAEEGKHYAYKIVAVNAAGESEESEIFDFDLLPEAKEDDVQSNDDDAKNDTAEEIKTVLTAGGIVIAILAVIILILVIILKKKNKKQ